MNFTSKQQFPADAFTCHISKTIPWYVATLYEAACKLFLTAYILGIFRYGKRDFPFQLLGNDILLSRNSIIIVTYGKEVVRISL